MRKLICFASIAIAAIALVSAVSNAQQSPSSQSAPQGKQGMPGMNMSQDDKQKEEADIQANMAKLSKEDRNLAEAQKVCPILTKNRLGVMGPPVKVMIKDQSVFLCCKNCKSKALANPDKTLATVAELLKANKKSESTK